MAFGGGGVASRRARRYEAARTAVCAHNDLSFFDDKTCIWTMDPRLRDGWVVTFWKSLFI